MNYILVASGGALGAVARYMLGTFVQSLAKDSSFPYGTLTVNMIGCLVIGLVLGLAEFRGSVGPSARLFLVVGILGGFTTFSSFGYETYQLLRQGDFLPGLANACAQNIAGIGLVGVGVMISRLV